MLLSELEDLEDVLDDIKPDENEEETLFSVEEESEMVDTCIQLMTEYIDENPTAISEPDFHDSMLENVKELLFMNFDNFFGTNSDLEEDVDNILDIATELFYLHIIPKRSFSYTYETKRTNNDIINISKRLEYLKSIPQSEQRTKEWYETRHRLITASNAYKAFENESTRNQLIYEKCQPLKIEDENTTIQKVELPNLNTSMHWGQKYEPVSVMYYEKTYNTKVTEYGCIQHDTYHFLGASPDGIVSDPLLPRFGRMLEIKNIVNREIDGIPKKEYWDQMQLQMETCDLNECDFLETRFIEYPSFDDFISDGDFLTSSKGDLKGIIMYFSSKDGKPLYIYKPLDMTEDYFEGTWELEQMEEYESKEYTWIKNFYWKLEEISCVLVLRNRKWFQDNIQELSNVWDIILKERENGFSHRAPVKRVKKIDAFFFKKDVEYVILYCAIKNYFFQVP
jgi:putative phage-type endonuclease